MRTLNVVVGVLLNEKNEVLIALRPPHVVQPGIWEFPGGKVEENETLENALIREFQEEIGIQITRAESFLNIVKYFPDKNLHLHVFRILSYSGAPFGRENQEVRWVLIDALSDYTFPEANAEIISMLKEKVRK